SNRIREFGGRKSEVLRPVQPGTLPDDKPAGEVLRDAVKRKDLAVAERTFAAVAQRSAEDALNELLCAVEDAQEVHRGVLPYRAWDLLPIIGREHALTLLRQSVHFCVKSESPRYSGYFDKSRELLPKLLDQYHLLGKVPGRQLAEDAWVEKMSQTIF